MAAGGAPTADPVAALEATLGVALPDRALAVTALTHKSWVNEHRDAAEGHNERLEFLGDAVVDLAVSQRLMERFPGADEGELSKMRASVVDERGLAEMARALGIGALLRLGRGEEQSGGREKPSVLADAMEAVIAVLFLSGGMPAVLALVDRFLGEAFARADAGTLLRDWKTQLQELAYGRLKAVPGYRIVEERGPDHAKRFVVEVRVSEGIVAVGEGGSKKEAEQAAAERCLPLLLARLGGGAP
jgi:ribonuclease-3